MLTSIRTSNLREPSSTLCSSRSGLETDLGEPVSYQQHRGANSKKEQERLSTLQACSKAEVITGRTRMRDSAANESMRAG